MNTALTYKVDCHTGTTTRLKANGANLDSFSATLSGRFNYKERTQIDPHFRVELPET